MSVSNRLIVGAGLTAMAGASAAGLYRFLLAQPRTPLDGVVSLPKLKTDVEIVRDRSGVPHIYAANRHDVFYALGYVHAQDRLWQIETNRRAARGRLSEIFGEATLTFDRFTRRLGLGHAATTEAIALGRDERPALEAYVAGINGFIQKHRWRLPLEFRILRFRPSPWSVEDVLAVGKMLSWLLSTNWDSELMRARLVEQLGLDAASAFEPGYAANHPLTVPPGISYAGLADSLLSEFQAAQNDLSVLTSGMSNSWAVSPAKSTTGSAILANDPHLRPQMPSIWYEAHLSGDGLNVTGATFPGLPTVMIGHNAHIAWGITVSMVDAQDLFVERVKDDATGQYETPLGWEPLTTRIEQIPVRGHSEPVIEEVHVTRHGPSLTPLLPSEKRFLAVQSPVLGAQQTARGAIQLMDAANWDEFRAAVADWGVSLNFVYADDQGNIGYQLSGQIPRRGKGTGLLPAPGWDADYDWSGLIPFDELPNAFNPECGYVVSANNRVVGDDYPYFLSHDWLDGFRAMRIENQLKARERHSLTDFAAMHLDFVSETARQIVELFADVESTDPLTARALEHLRRWDYRLTSNSVPAAIFSVLRLRLAHNVFGPRLGPLVGQYVGSEAAGGIAGSTYPARVNGFLIEQLRTADPAWLTSDGQSSTSPFTTWSDLKHASLTQAVVELRSRLGDDMDRWQWGKLHQVSFDHPFGQVKLLARIFSRGPYPIGGDGDTPCQTALAPGSYAATKWVPSYRQIVDLGNLSNSRSMHTTGQSGQPGSPHYDDMIPLWLEGSYHPMYFDRREILDNLAHMLVLRPEW